MRNTHATGFTLIEVLIAVAILSFGMLGIAAMQITGVRANQGSIVRSQATFIAMDMTERMYANRGGTRAGLYNFTSTAATSCAALPAGYVKCSEDLSSTSRSSCTSAQMATYDRFRVFCGMPSDAADTVASRLGGVRDLLPNGTLTVACAAQPAAPTAATPCSVTLTWEERAKSSTSTSSSTSQVVGAVTAQTQNLRMDLQP